MMVAIFWFVGRPLIGFVSQPERFRAWVDSHGILGRLAFVGMMMFQVFIAIIPGEPLEIGAGYAFGAIEGTLLCLLATTLSSVVIFLIVKRYGMKFVTLFVSEEKLHSLKFLRDTRRLELLAFLLFFIPGTPKDVLTYVVGLTPMKLRVWVLITAVARIPRWSPPPPGAAPWAPRTTAWPSSSLWRRPPSAAWGCSSTGPSRSATAGKAPLPRRTPLHKACILCISPPHPPSPPGISPCPPPHSPRKKDTETGRDFPFRFSFFHKQ